MHPTARAYVVEKFKTDKRIAAEASWSGIETIIRTYTWFQQFLRVGHRVADVLIPLVINGIKQAIAKDSDADKQDEFAEKISGQVDHLKAQVRGYLAEGDCDKVVAEVGSHPDQWPEEVKEAMAELSLDAQRYKNGAGEKKSFSYKVI